MRKNLTQNFNLTVYHINFELFLEDDYGEKFENVDNKRWLRFLFVSYFPL